MLLQFSLSPHPGSTASHDTPPNYPKKSSVLLQTLSLLKLVPQSAATHSLFPHSLPGPKRQDSQNLFLHFWLVPPSFYNALLNPILPISKYQVPLQLLAIQQSPASSDQDA